MYKLQCKRNVIILTLVALFCEVLRHHVIVNVECLVDPTLIERVLKQYEQYETNINSSITSRSRQKRLSVINIGHDEPSWSVKYEDSCYDRVRLPAHVQPLHYQLVMAPEMAGQSFRFHGAVQIDIDIDMQQFNSDSDSDSTSATSGSSRDSGINDIPAIDEQQLIVHVHNLNITHVSTNIRAAGAASKELSLVSVCVCQTFQVAVLNFNQPLTSGRWQLQLAFYGTLNEKLLRGFYRSRYSAPTTRAIAINNQSKPQLTHIKNNDSTNTSNSNNHSKRAKQREYFALTQFEATEARRAFPCLDEPSSKATFDVALIIPDDHEHIGLSNMPKISDKSIDHDQLKVKVVEFDTTPIMSTYLLAFIVGKFDRLVGDQHQQGRHVTVYTAPGTALMGQFTLDTAVRALEQFEQLLAIKYSLPKLDIVAVADFDSGAMENWGLITCREDDMLVHPNASTPSNLVIAARTVIHEIAHQWFGNLVTMTWWDNLWLKEGLATFMEFHITGRLFPEFGVHNEYIGKSRVQALINDASHSTHPVQATVEDPRDIDSIFDSISYDKGSAVITLLYDYVGNSAFWASLRNYLLEHAYGNADTDDLWSSFERVTHLPVREFMDSWTRQAGHPYLTVSIHKFIHTNLTSAIVLNVSQQLFTRDGKYVTGDDRQNHHWIVPINLASSLGTLNSSSFSFMSTSDNLTGVGTHSEANSAPTWPVVLKVRSMQLYVPLKVAQNTSVVSLQQSQTWWLKLNAGFTGFYRTLYSRELRDRLVKALSLPSSLPGKNENNRNNASHSSTMSVLDKLNIVDDTYAMMLANKLSAGETLRVLAAAASSPTVEPILVDNIDAQYNELASVLRSTQQLFVRYLEFGRRMYAHFFHAIGSWAQDDKRNDSAQVKACRAKIVTGCVYTNQTQVVRQALRMFDTTPVQYLSPSIRASVFYAVAMHGNEEQYSRLFAMFDQSVTREQQLELANAIASVNQTTRANKAIAWILSNDELRAQDKVYALKTLSATDAGRDTLWQAIDTKFDTFNRTLGIDSLDSVIVTTGSLFVPSLSPALLKDASTNSTSPLSRNIDVIERLFTNHPYSGWRDSRANIMDSIGSSVKFLRLEYRSIDAFLTRYLS